MLLLFLLLLLHHLQPLSGQLVSSCISIRKVLPLGLLVLQPVGQQLSESCLLLLLNLDLLTNIGSEQWYAQAGRVHIVE